MAWRSTGRLTWRHDIHQNAELSNREFRTAKKVADHLLKVYPKFLESADRNRGIQLPVCDSLGAAGGMILVGGLLARKKRQQP